MKAIRVNGFTGIDVTKVCYFKGNDGIWYLFYPKCGIGELSDHEVEEHEDGTISVKPSILITTNDDSKEVTVHGYLERGVWTNV